MTNRKYNGIAVAITMSAVLALGACAGTEKKAAKKKSPPKLIAYVVKDGGIAKSLTGKPGDPKKGRKLYINRKKGNCLACHTSTDMAKEPFHGNIGPSLDGVGSDMTTAELRLRIVDAKKINPATIMPAFYKYGKTRVAKKWKGKTILSAQEVEDVVAYLGTLKGK